MLRELGVSAHEAFFADDSARNVSVAHDLGLLVVFVGQDTLPVGVRGDAAVATLHDLPRVLPKLIACTEAEAAGARDGPNVVDHVEPGVEIESKAS